MISTHLPAPPFEDGRGLYPERLSAVVPRGFSDLVRGAAGLEGVTIAEFVRRALLHRLDQMSGSWPRRSAVSTIKSSPNFTR